jgi:UDP-N-acetylglucosamine acyltransferase
MTAEIHSTAVVHRDALVSDGCEVGPYCVVGPHVELGPGCRLHSSVVVDGHVRLGAGCEVFPFACIGEKSQDLKYREDVTYVEVGEGTTIREYVTIHAATEAGAVTRVGSGCHILAYCHVAHDCQVGEGVIISNCTQLAGHVTVGDRAVFGGLAAVHQFVRIGTMAMVSATAKVVQDVVPYCLVDGTPAAPVTVNRIGLERNGMDRERIAAISRAFRVLFRSRMPLAAALERLEQEFAGNADVACMVAFARAGRRGLARPRGRTRR